MAARGGNLDRLLGMQAGGRADDKGVGVAARQHLGQVAVRPGAGRQRGGGQGLGVEVAHADQFAAVGMLGDGIEVISGDAPAANQRKADPAIKYGGWKIAHGESFRSGSAQALMTLASGSRYTPRVSTISCACCWISA